MVITSMYVCQIEHCWSTSLSPHISSPLCSHCCATASGHCVGDTQTGCSASQRRERQAVECKGNCATGISLSLSLYIYIWIILRMDLFVYDLNVYVSKGREPRWVPGPSSWYSGLLLPTPFQPSLSLFNFYVSILESRLRMLASSRGMLGRKIHLARQQ